MQTRQTLVAVATILILGGGIGGYMLWNKPHRSVEHSKPVASLEAAALYASYETDEASANTAYLDQIIRVCGTITAIDDRPGMPLSIQLGTDSPLGSVLCEIDSQTYQTLPPLQPGVSCCIQGICTGYLMDVVLTRCVVIP